MLILINNHSSIRLNSLHPPRDPGLSYSLFCFLSVSTLINPPAPLHFKHIGAGKGYVSTSAHWPRQPESSWWTREDVGFFNSMCTRNSIHNSFSLKKWVLFSAIASSWLSDIVAFIETPSFRRRPQTYLKHKITGAVSLFQSLTFQTKYEQPRLTVLNTVTIVPGLGSICLHIHDYSPTCLRAQCFNSLISLYSFS